MENVKILIDGVEKEVYGLFYIYESKYYFIYTEKELDENDYTILYMVQIGKETQNTPTGPVDTGFMVGIEINDPEEQKRVQTSISYIVEDKKNGTTNPAIQYLPMSMLTNLKIMSKKRFKLLKNLMIENFKLNFDNVVESSTDVSNVPADNLAVEQEKSVQPTEALVSLDNLVNQQVVDNSSSNSDTQQTESNVQDNQNNILVAEEKPTENNVIIDYRTKYFEEEEKNKELELQIEQLTKKIDEIKKILE